MLTRAETVWTPTTRREGRGIARGEGDGRERAPSVAGPSCPTSPGSARARARRWAHPTRAGPRWRGDGTRGRRRGRAGRRSRTRRRTRTQGTWGRRAEEDDRADASWCPLEMDARSGCRYRARRRARPSRGGRPPRPRPPRTRRRDCACALFGRERFPSPWRRDPPRETPERRAALVETTMKPPPGPRARGCCSRTSPVRANAEGITFLDPTRSDRSSQTSRCTKFEKRPSRWRLSASPNISTRGPSTYRRARVRLVR